MADKPERLKYALPEEDDSGPEPPRKKRGTHPVITILVALLFVVFLLVLLLPTYHHPHGPANESVAVGNLRTLNTVLMTYYATYNNGYPTNLEMLGPPQAGPATCERADLLDPSLVSADNVVEKSGYRIEYRPGPPVEEAGPDCTAPGVESYAITARPIAYEKTGFRSFYTDETMLITFTREDREATAEDEPL